MKLSCIIIDDESPARTLMREYVKQVPNLELIADFKSPIEAIECLNSKKPEVLFLDIQMPGLTGIELIKALSYKPSIILTTAYSEYAVEGFELDVVDYLMKPIPFERFIKAVNKVVQLKAERHSIPAASSEISHEKDYILVKADGQTHRVKYSQILYIEGLREYVTFHMDGKKLIVLESLRHLEESLPSPTFIRVHKSFIVNCDHVESLSGNQITIKNKHIPIGQSYREHVVDKIF